MVQVIEIPFQRLQNPPDLYIPGYYDEHFCTPHERKLIISVLLEVYHDGKYAGLEKVHGKHKSTILFTLLLNLNTVPFQNNTCELSGGWHSFVLVRSDQHWQITEHIPTL